MADLADAGFVVVGADAGSMPNRRAGLQRVGPVRLFDPRGPRTTDWRSAHPAASVTDRSGRWRQPPRQRPCGAAPPASFVARSGDDHAWRGLCGVGCTVSHRCPVQTLSRSALVMPSRDGVACYESVAGDLVF